MSASSRSETVRGTITTNGGVVTLPLGGLPAAGLTITGTWTGTLQVEETFDGDVWSNCKVLTEADVAVSLPLTANQIGLIKAQGRAAVRVRASAWTSGSAVVVLNATEGQVGGSSGGGGGSTDPTAPNAVELSDGTVYYQAATQTTAALIKAKTDNLDVLLSTRTKPADQQHAIVDSSALPAGASTEATLASVLAKIIAAPATEATLASVLAKIIAAPATEATLALIKTDVDKIPASPATDRTTAAAPGSVELSDGAAFYTAAKTGQLPAALVANRVDVNLGKVPGTISTANSSAVNLANGAVFTGTSEDVSGYSSISVNVFADQSSAANGLSLQWSSNGTNWDIVNTSTVTLNVGLTVLLPPRAQFFRIVYTNGGVTQTNFRLQSVFHQVPVNGDVGLAAQQAQGTVPTGTANASAGNPIFVATQGTTTIQSPITLATGNDGIGSINGLNTMATAFAWNGASFDRQRHNIDATLLASAARTTLQNSANIVTYNCKGIIVTVDITATVSTVSLTPSINYIDPASGKAIPLLTGTTLAAAGTTTYWVDEAALASVPAPFTKTAQAALGRVITINIAVGNANSQTYSVGYTLIP